MLKEQQAARAKDESASSSGSDSDSSEDDRVGGQGLMRMTHGIKFRILSLTALASLCTLFFWLNVGMG